MAALTSQDRHQRPPNSIPSSPDLEADNQTFNPRHNTAIDPQEPSGLNITSDPASLDQSRFLASATSSRSRPADRGEPLATSSRNTASEGVPHDDLGENIYDTSAYLDNKLESANPVLIYPLLITAALYLFEHISISTASWLLGALRGLIQLVRLISLGRFQPEDPEDLLFFDQLTLEELPRDIRTIISKFQLDPKLMVFNCCPTCFALYHPGQTPPKCTYQLNEVPGFFSLDQPMDVDHSSLDKDETCSEELFQADDSDPEVVAHNVQDTRNLLNDMANEDLYEIEASQPPPANDGVCFNDIEFNTNTSSNDTDYENQELMVVLFTGQMEITFMKGFSRAGNLAALLKGKRVPTALNPYLPQLCSLFEPIPYVPKTTSSSDQKKAIDADIYKQMIEHMNRERLNECAWKSASEWNFLPENEKRVTAPVSDSARFVKRYVHKGVNFTTFETSKANSVVQVRSQVNNMMSFGKINSIFVHRRTPIGSLSSLDDTWVSVELFQPVPPSKPNCFLRLDEPDVQAHLRITTTAAPSLIHISQIVSHCAWIEYQSKEITPLLDLPSIALVSLDRE
ncbi:uncharacterized protein MELLADRAFT_69491 [Melampsora larici-populina 98AG31]|uniref:Uncharacterized protein n=1 Tax=Melampsora larici-populina (strain 98AG31 / pathotype 3-4-7) TaxID=747676 RepID=F4SAX8_MELLP|nr:uncharacterized protein MELLADRAFT_69491 [Melampsora larici-populina 98AG31]EGF98185.1 hypothetical protein MELLADRAFT_69491 [Melampsora larici-populina 98AG31]